MGTTVFPERVQAQKIVSDLADSLGSTLTEAGARAILTLKLNGPTPERRQELAGKANEGLLTAEEFAEYETYAQLRGLLAALQSKARLYLKQSGPAPSRRTPPLDSPAPSRRTPPLDSPA